MNEGMVVRYVEPFPEVKPPRLNTEEMKVAATKFADKYTGMVVTRENYADGRKAAAEQNAVIGQLKAMKTELNRKAKAIVQPALDAIDEVLAIVETPYKALKDGLDELRDAAVKEKMEAMNKIADEISGRTFPELSGAAEHLRKLVAMKSAEKRDGWLVKRWTLDMVRDEIEAEADRMAKAMSFVSAHMAGKAPDVVRTAKVALIACGFDEVRALDAADKFEKTLEEQRRMKEAKAGRDPDADPTERKVATSDPIPAVEREMEATVKFTGTVAGMRKLVALIKKAGICYEVIDQHYVGK